MTDEKKKPEEDEVSDEQLEDVAGRYVLPAKSSTVMDKIAGQSISVLGAADALSAANDALLGQLPGISITPQDEGEVPTKGS